MGTLMVRTKADLKDVRNPRGVADLLGFDYPNDGNGNLYFWDDGNYFADIDDALYIASNHIPSTLGAWISLTVLRPYNQVPICYQRRFDWIMLEQLG